jgi:hypothetical protein
VKGDGEPCAGKSHARFEGRGLETERLRVTAPVPDPTATHLSLPCLGSLVSATPDFTVCEIGATRFEAETCRAGGMPREIAKIIFPLRPDRIGSAESPTRPRSPATFRVVTGDSPWA